MSSNKDKKNIYEHSKNWQTNINNSTVVFDVKKNTPPIKNYTYQKDLNKSIEANADNNGGIVPVLQMSTEFKICLQNARQFNNLSQSDLAKKLNVQSNLYQRWESGKENPPPNIIAKLNNILKVKLPKISKNTNKL